jgi:GntR family transcriptional regulator/MocR family aminotransferase
VAWLNDADEAAIATEARERGVAVHELHAQCTVARPQPPALLLGYAATPEAGLGRAARRLGEAARAASPSA